MMAGVLNSRPLFCDEAARRRDGILTLLSAPDSQGYGAHIHGVDDGVDGTAHTDGEMGGDGPAHAKAVAAVFRQLVRDGLADLPLPAAGRTLDRWRVLSDVASHDLSLAKLFEGHTDALAILAELGAASPGADCTLGTWAAEPPGVRVLFTGADENGRVRLHGEKAWCSGADIVSHGLLTVWPSSVDADVEHAHHSPGDAPSGKPAGPWLAWVSLNQPGVAVSGRGWHAVGMAASSAWQVTFENASAQLVGQAGDYLTRPGFWHGGAGIAACWWGGARSLARQLQMSMSRGSEDGFKLAALGKADLALQQTATLLREAASWIDAHPHEDAGEVACRLRLSAEQAARMVLDEVGRALGAGPFCRDAAFARMAADLPVFIRQSHGEKDFASLGRQVLAQVRENPSEAPWSL